MRSVFFGAASALIFGLAVSSASAAVFDVTYNGAVTNGLDALNLFGGGDLTGDAVTTVVRIDTSRGELTPDNSYLQGGALNSHGFASPFDFADVTINGHTVSVGIGFNDYECILNSGVNAQICDNVSGYANNHYWQVGNTVLWTQDFHFDQAYPTTAGPYGGYFQVFDPNTNNLQEGLTFGGARQFDGFGTVTVEAVQTSAAPEPAGWALMILGFGAAGATLRRRRSVLA